VDDKEATVPESPFHVQDSADHHFHTCRIFKEQSVIKVYTATGLGMLHIVKRKILIAESG
jgi:hypothetical protein